MSRLAQMAGKRTIISLLASVPGLASASRKSYEKKWKRKRKRRVQKSFAQALLIYSFSYLPQLAAVYVRASIPSKVGKLHNEPLTAYRVTDSNHSLF